MFQFVFITNVNSVTWLKERFHVSLCYQIVVITNHLKILYGIKYQRNITKTIVQA